MKDSKQILIHDPIANIQIPYKVYLLSSKTIVYDSLKEAL